MNKCAVVSCVATDVATIRPVTDLIEHALTTAGARARGLLSAGHDLVPIELHDKQTEFVEDDRLEVLFGGAAGGGKSVAMLASSLKYVHVPGTASLLVRRSYSHLSQPGGLIALSRAWLAGTATYHAATFTWHFPNGSTLTFGHLDSERDLDKYQGAEYQFVGFDELTQFPENYFRYLFSRLRRREGIGVPLRMRGSSNPGGIGHDWVKRRYIVEERDDRRFIPSLLTDNPSLDQAEYLRSLEHLDPLTRQRLLEGDWDATADGGMFKREWMHILGQWDVPKSLRPIRYWDRAATVPQKGRDPDWTAGALVGFHQGVWYVLDMQHFRGTSETNEKRIRQVAEADTRRVPVYMEREPGSSGLDVISHYARRVLPGFTFRGVRPTGPKTERAAPVASAAEQGNLRLVAGPWVSAFLDEAGAFPLGPHDDQIDAVSGAFGQLIKRRRLRSFTIKDI